MADLFPTKTRPQLLCGVNDGQVAYSTTTTASSTRLTRRSGSETNPMRTWTFPEVRPAGDGPWAGEPDKAQWVDEATGLDCLIVRNHLGALCGYVGLPPGHRLHGVDYDAAYEIADIEVHGGLTFASRCQEGAEDGYGICHVAEPGRPAEVWWLGFDCAHAFDLIPGTRETYAAAGITRDLAGDVYRDFAYVQREVTELARQLAGESA